MKAVYWHNETTQLCGQQQKVERKPETENVRTLTRLPINNDLAICAIAPTKLMKDLNYGKNYKYAHSYQGNFADLEFLPEKIIGSKFYEPGYNVRENEIRNSLRKWWREKYGY